MDIYVVDKLNDVVPDDIFCLFAIFRPCLELYYHIYENKCCSCGVPGCPYGQGLPEVVLSSNDCFRFHLDYFLFN